MTGKEERALEAEAELFGLYLLGRPIHARARAMYLEAMEAAPHTLSHRDQAVMRFAARHPRTLGLLDAGLALLRPNDELRRRLFIMFSILETSPLYADVFLPKHHGIWHLGEVIYNGVKGVFKVLFGALLVKVIMR